MKNYVREGQKLPIFGIGPAMIAGMSLVGLVGVLRSGSVLESGQAGGIWVWLFHIIGGILILFGLGVWYVGAMKSDMDEHIASNRLKTDGIYAWVRNPMYSGWLFLIFGVVLQWCNYWLLLVFPIDWLIMSVVLSCTEERWLRGVYGEAYVAYCKRVNRCIPFKGRQGPRG